jgi:hypothetical protein
MRVRLQYCLKRRIQKIEHTIGFVSLGSKRLRQFQCQHDLLPASRILLSSISHSSPSTISINSLSISAPLTRTASCMYESPTTTTVMMVPEQLKAIAAREDWQVLGAIWAGCCLRRRKKGLLGWVRRLGRQKDREEREVGLRHDAYIRGGTSVSASPIPKHL